MSLLASLPAPKQAVAPLAAPQPASSSLLAAGAKEAPPYLRRQSFVPRKPEDFGDGGAFPEIHVAQYPLGMGKDTGAPGDRTLAVTINSEGEVNFDAVLRQGQNRNKIIHSQHRALVPKVDAINGEGMERPDDEEIEKTKAETALALLGVVEKKLAINQLKALPTLPGAASYIKYTPSQQGVQYASGAGQRIIKMQDMPVDPLEPPKFRHTKAPRGAGSPPVPVMHSPPRPVSAEEAGNWKIPPSISNWKNPKGYTIPLDKRLAADGRGLQVQQINDKFASLAESLQLAEKKAREQIEYRNRVQQEIKAAEKARKEQELRELALKARQERGGGLAGRLDGGGGSPSSGWPGRCLPSGGGVAAQGAAGVAWLPPVPPGLGCAAGCWPSCLATSPGAGRLRALHTGGALLQRQAAGRPGPRRPGCSGGDSAGHASPPAHPPAAPHTATCDRSKPQPPHRPHCPLPRAAAVPLPPPPARGEPGRPGSPDSYERAPQGASGSAAAAAAAAAAVAAAGGLPPPPPRPSTRDYRDDDETAEERRARKEREELMSERKRERRRGGASLLAPPRPRTLAARPAAACGAAGCRWRPAPRHPCAPACCRWRAAHAARPRHARAPLAASRPAAPPALCRRRRAGARAAAGGQGRPRARQEVQADPRQGQGHRREDGAGHGGGARRCCRCCCCSCCLRRRYAPSSSGVA
jgi:hypothetical protein